MLIVQQYKKLKVYPVTDYKDINWYVNVFPTDAEVCTSKFRM